MPHYDNYLIMNNTTYEWLQDNYSLLELITPESTNTLKHYKKTKTNLEPRLNDILKSKTR